MSLWDLLRATWKSGSLLPKDSTARKDFPLYGGFDAYFPAAIVAVAGWSKTSNERHNPGQTLTHARWKSSDHQDCQRRHGLDSADPSCDKLEELTCKAWRALAELQEYAETLGAPVAPAATFQAPVPSVTTPPGIYDPARHQWVEHPAQLMAIEAFKKEQAPIPVKYCRLCGLSETSEPTVVAHSGFGVFCADCWNKGKPKAEQWGVFYRNPHDSILRRSTEVPGEYPTEHDAMCAAADYCNKMNSCNWFAQKLV